MTSFELIPIKSVVATAIPGIPKPVREWIISTVIDPYATTMFIKNNIDPHQILIDFLSPVLRNEFILKQTASAKQAKFINLPSDKEIHTLCKQLIPYIGQLAHQDVLDSAPQRLSKGPVHISGMNQSNNRNNGNTADITHATTSRKLNTTRVDSNKLEKAELKLKAKMEKRQTSIEVSFKVIDKKQQGATARELSDAQIRDILAARGKNNDILLSNFDISHVGLRILTNANLSLVYGRRYGLVGRNGIGKSTLLRAIALREINGMDKFKHVSIGYVEQEMSLNEMTVLDSVVSADMYRSYLLRQEADLQAQLLKFGDIETIEEEEETDTMDASEVQLVQSKLKQVYLKMEEIDAHTAEARAGVILAGLGFVKEDQGKFTHEFSGGWKMRIALARSLFTRPDLLLLDEPTNHLDIPAVVWLSNYLQKWPSTLLVVSHDREFLDQIATDIMHQHDERLDVYKGNFSIFEKTADERRKQAVREYESQLQHRQHLQAFVDRWRYNAKKAPQAQARLKMLEKLPELEVPTEEITVNFQFPKPEKISPPILQLDDAMFGYSKDKIIVRNVNLDVQLNSRVAVVGPNGAGKSTVLKLLTGQLEPLQGQVFRHGRLRFAFFSQHHVDALEDLTLTPVQFLMKNFSGHPEEEYRRQLGCFGISGRVGLQAMGTLSGGQKSRVVFASLALQRPHILVLDEPTNHLDYMSVDSLANALSNFGGGVLIVSHDQRFIDMCCNEIWVCDQGQLIKFAGESIADYRATLDIPE